MRRILLFLIAIFVAVGCVDSAHTISVLNAADSLISERPDSAYRLLQTLDGGRIWQDENEAKYALLLTQAKYKNYIKSESDSLINIAVEYYKAAENPDMYARALFYQGTVNGDMGDSDAAIESYKAADATGTTDTLLLGFINTNIGWLYSELSFTAEGISRFKAAIKYFNSTHRIDAASYAARRIGHSFTIDKKQDSAQYYLHYGYELAAKASDTAGMCHAQMLLVESYVREGRLQKAKDAYAKTEQLDSIYVNIALFYSLSRLYVKEKNIDSARYYLGRCLDGATHQVDTLQYYFAACSVEELAGNYKAALDFLTKANNLENRIQREDAASKLYEIDRRYDKQRVEDANKELKFEAKIYWFIIIITFLVLTIVAILGLQFIQRKNRNIKERSEFITQLQAESIESTNSFLSKLDKSSKIEEELKTYLENRLGTIRQLIELSYRYGTLKPELFVKRFNSIVNIEELDQGALSDFIAVVNTKYYGFVDYIKGQYPTLNDDDIDLLCLICSGFSNLEMTVFFKYNNEKSIYAKRSRLAAKMGVKTSLEEYIASNIEYLKKV